MPFLSTFDQHGYPRLVTTHSDTAIGFHLVLSPYSVLGYIKHTDSPKWVPECSPVLWLPLPDKSHWEMMSWASTFNYSEFVLFAQPRTCTDPPFACLPEYDMLALWSNVLLLLFHLVNCQWGEAHGFSFVAALLKPENMTWRQKDGQRWAWRKAKSNHILMDLTGKGVNEKVWKVLPCMCAVQCPISQWDDGFIATGQRSLHSF